MLQLASCRFLNNVFPKILSREEMDLDRHIKILIDMPFNKLSFTVMVFIYFNHVFYNAKVVFTYWQLDFLICSIGVPKAFATKIKYYNIKISLPFYQAHPIRCFACFTCVFLCFKTRQSQVYLYFSYFHAILDQAKNGFSSVFWVRHPNEIKIEKQNDE